MQPRKANSISDSIPTARATQVRPIGERFPNVSV